jgi:hypothetical protein
VAKGKRRIPSVINSSNIDSVINTFINDTSGRHITQGVSFSKNNPREVQLLRKALLEPYSFSSLIKMLLTERYEGRLVHVSKDDSQDDLSDSSTTKPTESGKLKLTNSWGKK